MEEFQELVDVCNSNGIKVVIDFVTNHTSRRANPTLGEQPEDGRLYEPDKDEYGNYVFDTNGNPYDYNGDGTIHNLVADPHNDINGWFHHEGNRDWTTDSTKFGFRHKELAYLADFSQENSKVTKYLEDATAFWASKGISRIRHDATLHMNPAFTRNLRDAVDTAVGVPLFHFGEFFIARPDPKYDEFKTFPERTGVNNLDFEYYRAATTTFGDFSTSMGDFGYMMEYTSDDYIYENQTVTFLDNHDVTRLGYLQQNQKVINAAIATLMTSRGIPNIYYGTEQYVTPTDASDVAGRVFMQTAANFDETSAAYRTIKKLSDLRQFNNALAYGETRVLYSTDNVLVFQRQYYDDVVVMAVNRQPDIGYQIPGITGSALPNGTYADALSGILYGDSNIVSNGVINSFYLGGGEVSCWQYKTPVSVTPRIKEVQSYMGRPGNTINILGEGLSGNVTVKFGDTVAQVISSSDEKLVVTVPNAPAGVTNVTVTKNGSVSNLYRFEVLGGDLTQVIFHVQANTSYGENIYIVGSIPELGNWDPAKSTEAMMCPNYPEWFLPVSVPENTYFEFKFIKKDSLGNVVWESGSNRVFTAPSAVTDIVDTGLYYFGA